MATLFILLAEGAPAQEPVFRTDVSQVKVDVQVSVQGRPVADLKKDDFIVREEGVPQQIVYFGRDSEPLSLLLLLDVSGSMRKFVGQMADSAERALRYLQPGDRTAVMLFSRRTELEQEFSTDQREVAVRIHSASEPHDLGAGTVINEAILSAADHLREYADAHPRPERRSILILTDNKGLNYQIPDDMVVKKLFATDAVLNAIVVGRVAKPERAAPGGYRNPDFTQPDVFSIAGQTGGEAIKADRVDKSFPEILERIRTRYSLSYNMPDSPAGVFRRIAVELTPEAARRYPKAEIRARNGYYTPNKQ